MALDYVLNIDDRSITELNNILKLLKKTIEGVGDETQILEYMKAVKSVTKAIEKKTKVTKEDTKAIDDNNEATDDATKSLSNLEKTFEDVHGEVLTTSGKLGELEDRMYAMAEAGDTSSESFIELQEEAGRLRQTMIKVDEGVDDLAANRGLSSFGSQLGGVGQSLLTLDFERANKQSAALAKTAQTISFKKAAGSVKALGKTFLNLGKALLANPLFLIVAVIVIIAVVIVKLLKKLGLLKLIMKAIGKVFEFFMAILDALLQPLKDLTDFLGLTSHAAQKAAEEHAEAAKKTSEAYSTASKDIIQSLDNEIRMLELRGESTEELHEERLERLRLGAKLQAQSDKAAFESAKFNDDLSKEEKQTIKDTAQTSRLASLQAVDDIKFANAEKAKAGKEFHRDQAVREKAARVALNADTLEGQIEQLKLERNTALQQENLTASEILKIKKDFNDKSSALEEADRKARIAKWKSFKSARLSAERQIQDIELSLLEDGLPKQLDILDTKYKRLIEDTKNNEKLLASEKADLIEVLVKQQIQQEAKIRKEADDKVLEEQKKFNDALADINEVATDDIKEQLENEYLLNKEKLIKEFTDEEEQKKLLLALEQKYNTDLETINAEAAERERLAKIELDAVDLEGKLEKIESDRLLELEQKDLTESEKFLIDEKYSLLRKDLLEAERLENIKNLNDSLDLAKQGMGAVQGIADAVFAHKTKNLEKGSKEEEKILRKQFDLNKAMQLGGAIIDGGKAVLASLAASPVAIGPIPNPAGIASLAFVAASSIASIAKIGATRFEGTATAPVAVTAPSISSSSPSSSPQFDFFGTGGDANNVSSTQSTEGNQTINVDATISVTEITETQENVAQIEENRNL